MCVGSYLGTVGTGRDRLSPCIVAKVGICSVTVQVIVAVPVQMITIYMYRCNVPLQESGVVNLYRFIVPVQDCKDWEQADLEVSQCQGRTGEERGAFQGEGRGRRYLYS